MNTHCKKTDSNSVDMPLRGALSFLLAILLTYFFVDKPPGISVLIFVLVFLMGLAWITRHQPAWHRNGNWLLLIPIILLAATFTLFSNGFLLQLNGFIIPILLMVLTVSLTTAEPHSSSDPVSLWEYILTTFPNHIREAVIDPFRMGRQAVRLLTQEQFYVVRGVLFGSAVAVPLLILVVPLLAAADPIFHANVFDALEVVLAWDLVSIVSFVLWTALFLVGLLGFWRIVAGLQGAHITFDSEAGPIKRWDAVIVATLLVILNLIYLSFIVIQFSYLFANDPLQQIAGFNTAAFARRGFGELIVVILLNIGLVLGSLRWIRPASPTLEHMLRWLLFLLIDATAIILYFAHVRLSMYEAQWGYTEARVLAHFGMLFFLLMLILAIVKIIKPALSYRLLFTIAFAVWIVALNYVNIDRLIAQQNIERYQVSGQIDVDYLCTLSDDAIPELARLIAVPDTTVSNPLKTHLAHRQERLSAETDWPSYNTTKQQASGFLEAISTKRK